jgi:hypothetical protein
MRGDKMRDIVHAIAVGDRVSQVVIADMVHVAVRGEQQKPRPPPEPAGCLHQRRPECLSDTCINDYQGLPGPMDHRICHVRLTSTGNKRLPDHKLSVPVDRDQIT